MWENRCKVAVSGVGFSKVTRSAEIPLAAHALQAVKGAVEDSGLDMADIDGLATYPELPATGHAVIDGVTIVSVNCMMAMLKLPNLSWHTQVETVNKADSNVTVSSSVNPSVFGQSVTFTATVAAVAPGAGTPSGTVAFKDGAATLSTVALAAGSATFSSSSSAGFCATGP